MGIGEIDLPVGVLADIHEGRVWSEFSSVVGRPFLSQPNNLCLMLNIDWFNPYDEHLILLVLYTLYFKIFQEVKDTSLRILFWLE